MGGGQQGNDGASQSLFAGVGGVAVRRALASVTGATVWLLRRDLTCELTTCDLTNLSLASAPPRAPLGVFVFALDRARRPVVSARDGSGPRTNGRRSKKRAPPRCCPPPPPSCPLQALLACLLPPSISLSLFLPSPSQSPSLRLFPPFCVDVSIAVVGSSCVSCRIAYHGPAPAGLGVVLYLSQALSLT